MIGGKLARGVRRLEHVAPDRANPARSVSDASSCKRGLTIEVERTVLGSPRRPLVPTVRRRIVGRIGVRVTKRDKVFDLARCDTERD